LPDFGVMPLAEIRCSRDRRGLGDRVLLRKALVDQGLAVSLGFGLTSLVYFASIPGKGFTGFLMEIIGRRWTIAYALAGSLPGLFLKLMAHQAGEYATVAMVTGALITGFTVLSAFTATRVYLSEQFPTALRGRGHIFGESTGRLFAGVLAPFLMEPSHRLGDDILRYDFRGGGDRNLHPAGLWPRDRRPA
jgi:MFS family permease